MREWLARVRDWFRRDALDMELDEELAFHRAMLERDGATPDGARRALGSTLRAKADARARWSLPWAERLAQDVRYAVRGLRRAPGFTATVVLTLGLGVGANAAMFSVVDRLMFRPFPYLRDPGTVHRVYLQATGRERVRTWSVMPYARYADLARWTTSFAAHAAVAQRPLAVGVGDDAREREVAGVTASLFAFFDAAPARGRFFGAAEDVVPRGAPVAVLAYRYWREAFGADGDIVGRALQVGNATYTVIGVAPPGFVGASAERAPDVFVPITTLPAAMGENKVDTYHLQYNWDWTTVMMRRRAGVSEAAATADLTAAFVRSRAVQRAQVPEVTPDEIARPRAIAGAARPAAGPGAGLESRTLLWVSGVALVVLVIAWANAANLALGRALRRHRETAMRLALGVSRRRLAAQALVEGTILALLGGAAGVLAAQWGGAALRALVLREEIALGVVADGRTLLAAGALALAAGALTALAPVLLQVRGDLAPTLRAGARADTPRRTRARSTLLVVQAALSVALLVGAALFVRSLRNVREMRLGYEPEPVLIVQPNYRGVTMDSAARVAFRRRLLDAARAVPGVVAVARVNSRPFSTNSRALFVAGIDSVERLGRFNYQLGSADFFAVMGTRVVRGRPFDASDREGAPLVAVVSESMARALWPGRDPLGMCLHLRARSSPCVAVVGVTEDVAEHSLTDEQRFVYYLPLEQQDPAGGNRMFVRVAGSDAARHADAVRRALQREMPGQGYVTVQPLEELVAEQRRSWQLGATMFAAFGVLALVVAAIGLYGVVAYDVAQRTRELGIRAALGARAADVARLVVGQGVALAVTGVAAGLAAALAASPWIQPLLFRQSATDPAAYAVVAAALLLVAVLASAVPALRAARADPNAVLRAE